MLKHRIRYVSWQGTWRRSHHPCRIFRYTNTISITPPCSMWSKDKLPPFNNLFSFICPCFGSSSSITWSGRWLYRTDSFSRLLLHTRRSIVDIFSPRIVVEAPPTRQGTLRITYTSISNTHVEARAWTGLCSLPECRWNLLQLGF